MKKKAIVFDLDGTLLDTREDIALAVNFALKKNGLNEVSIEEVVKNTGRGNKNLIKDCAKTVDEEILNKIYQDFVLYYNEHYANKTKAYEGLIETLQVLKNKGYKMAVVSNKVDAITKSIVKYYFNDTFDYITGARDNIKLKPARDIVDIALSNLGVKTEDAVYIGDSLVDYATAVNSNMDSIIVSYGYVEKEELEKRGCPIIIDSPKDILNLL